jgi:hypothetical protein
MNAAETIATAIEKLEGLRPGYEVRGEWLVEVVGEHTCGGYGEASGWLHEPGCGYEPLTNDPIVVTLHRTIDAQLAILRMFGANLALLGDWEPHPDNEIMALARAVLGGDS